MLASLIAFASGESAEIVRRLRRAALVYALAGFAILAAVVFLIAAAYLYAARHYGTIEAAVGFAAGFLVVALLLVAVHRITARVHARRVAKRRSGDLVTLGGAAAVALLPMLPALFRRRGAAAGALLVPLAALAVYAIYKENSGPGPGRTPPS